MSKIPKTRKKARAFGLFTSFGRDVRRRLTKKAADEFRRVTPSELDSIGRSKTSERYVENSAGRLTKRTPTISKRQFAEKRLSEEAGHRVTLERRAHEYLTGEREARTAKTAQLRAQSVEAWTLRRRYKGESVKRVREHQRNMELKERGEYLDQDVFLREKAFAEAHFDVPDERQFYQKWFNYGHTRRAIRGQKATGRSAA
jgi:hypothetical protein